MTNDIYRVYEKHCDDRTTLLSEYDTEEEAKKIVFDMNMASRGLHQSSGFYYQKEERRK